MNIRKMSNIQLIQMALEAEEKSYKYDGTNLKTFAAWKASGYVVKRGEKAYIKTQLWTPITTKVKDEQTGEERTETKLYLKKAALFTKEQVKPIEKKQKQTA